MKKKLPIGISTFSEIIEENYVYVDKTAVALDLISSSKYNFLSRPRRFGKSLFLDTLKTIFEGKKELFKGLYIYDKYDWGKTYPVINISFAESGISSKGDLFATIDYLLSINEEKYEVSSYNESFKRRTFFTLIRETYKKYNKRVVILVDEYDKPILDNIEKPDISMEIRDELKHFYSVIKASDEYLKFVFITGVSKFSKVSLFSGLNNLNDITLNPNYSTICGYTQQDIETVFAEHLNGQDFDKIREWYNGYKWRGEPVYNPFDILLFISNNYEYRNYWFSTETPAFLLKLIEKNRYFLPNLENVIKDEMLLNSFDVDYIELETLMWQTGYLTIDEAYEVPKGIKYKLRIPNKEVEVSLFSTIADFISRIHNTELLQDNIYNSLLNADFGGLELNLKSLFASIPYNNFTGVKLYEYEGYYTSLFYTYLKAIGIEVIGEDVTNKGRIDLTVKMPNGVFIFEFKTDGKDALKQIKEKRYYEKYISLNKPIYLVGIEFSTEERNIVKMGWEGVLDVRREQ